MTCKACETAQKNPRTGMFQAGCPECSARALASGIPFFESGRASKILPAYRQALEKSFGDDWQSGHAKVKEWAKRLKKGAA